MLNIISKVSLKADLFFHFFKSCQKIFQFQKYRNYQSQPDQLYD